MPNLKWTSTKPLTPPHLQTCGMPLSDSIISFDVREQSVKISRKSLRKTPVGHGLLESFPARHYGADLIKLFTFLTEQRPETLVR